MTKHTSRRTSVMAVSEGPTRSFIKWDLWKAWIQKIFSSTNEQFHH